MYMYTSMFSLSTPILKKQNSLLVSYFATSNFKMMSDFA